MSPQEAAKQLAEIKMLLTSTMYFKERQALKVAISALEREAKAEPVAWRSRHVPYVDWVLTKDHPNMSAGYHQAQIEPLYASPPQRTPASQVRDVPEGWVLLPMCLTRDMLDAIQREAVVGPSTAEHVWKHILSAAPPAPNNPEGWQPIETAPRDGTEILGAFFGQPWADSHRTGIVVKCWWQPQFEAFISAARIMSLAPGYTFDDGETERYHSAFIEKVSHWMPLPSPPAPKTDE